MWSTYTRSNKVENGLDLDPLTCWAIWIVYILGEPAYQVWGRWGSACCISCGRTTNHPTDQPTCAKQYAPPLRRTQKYQISTILYPFNHLEDTFTRIFISSLTVYTVFIRAPSTSKFKVKVPQWPSFLNFLVCNCQLNTLYILNTIAFNKWHTDTPSANKFHTGKGDNLNVSYPQIRDCACAVSECKKKYLMHHTYLDNLLQNKILNCFN